MQPLLFLAGLLLTATITRADMIGYRGDGFCVERTGKPPTEFDVAAGKNFLWKTPLPNWGLGCPIAVKDRVFVVCEPDRHHDFPVLVALNAADGNILWQHEIAHAVDAAPRQAWHDHLVALRALYKARHDYATAPDKDAILPALADRGFEPGTKGAVMWKGDGTKRGDRKDCEYARTFNKGGLYFDVWHLGGLGRIGYGYPTPVSDGQRLYIATGLHQFACYDLDGKRLWQTRSIGQGSSQAGYGGDDFCKNARSPLLHGNLLLSDVGNLVRAFDKETGKILWSDKHTGHEIVTPVILTVAGQEILLTATMAAYELPAGKKLTVTGWNDHGGTMLVKSDEPNIVFFTGGGEHGGWEHKGQPPCAHPPPAAVKFTRAADTLQAAVLWSGIEGKTSGEYHTGLVYHAGKLYHPGGVILDALTGKILAGKFRDRQTRATPQTRHLLWIAGDHVYGVREEKGKDGAPARGVIEVYDLAGKKVSGAALPVAELKGDRLEHVIETTGQAGWGFSYGSPFTIAGNRLYVRGNDYLYCLGTR